jgi:hypothetical protein
VGGCNSKVCIRDAVTVGGVVLHSMNWRQHACAVLAWWLCCLLHADCQFAEGPYSTRSHNSHALNSLAALVRLNDRMQAEIRQPGIENAVAIVCRAICYGDKGHEVQRSAGSPATQFEQ